MWKSICIYIYSLFDRIFTFVYLVSFFFFSPHSENCLLGVVSFDIFQMFANFIHVVFIWFTGKKTHTQIRSYTFTVLWTEPPFLFLILSLFHFPPFRRIIYFQIKFVLSSYQPWTTTTTKNALWNIVSKKKEETL